MRVTRKGQPRAQSHPPGPSVSTMDSSASWPGSRLWKVSDP